MKTLLQDTYSVFIAQEILHRHIMDLPLALKAATWNDGGLALSHVPATSGSLPKAT